MAYTDPNFNVTIQDTVIGGGPGLGVSLGTVTASATQTYTGTAGSQVNGTFRLPIFKNAANIKGIRVYTVSAQAGSVTSLILGFYNGTALVGSCTSAAAGTYVDATMSALSTDSHGVITGAAYFTANTEMTMINTAVGTASGGALGSYSVDFLWQNLNT
jgi:hypothetical protein